MKKVYTFDEFLKEVQPFAKKVKELGGDAYLVGGCVRDHVLGKPPQDWDIVLTGLTKEAYQRAFPTARFIGDGDTFPVFLTTIGEELCEVAFARKEKKVAQGYKGFETYTDTRLTIEDDLVRRDVTMNAMAVHILSQAFIDPFGGVQDIQNKVLRHVSEAFGEDPLRVLRVARFAARFSFTVDEKTQQLMHTLKDELKTLPHERIVVETKKALACDEPARYFQVLAQVDVLDAHYPEVNRLRGVEQPVRYHPEGDAFVHTMCVLNEMAKLTPRIEARFAALVHDFGKGISPKKWKNQPEFHPFGTHRGHEEAGVPIVQSFCHRLQVPKKWEKAGVFGTRYHGRMHQFHSYTQKKSVRTLVEMIDEGNKNPLGLDGLLQLALADERGKEKVLTEHPNTPLWDKVVPRVLAVKANPALPVTEIKEDKINRQIALFLAIKKECRDL